MTVIADREIVLTEPLKLALVKLRLQGVPHNVVTHDILRECRLDLGGIRPGWQYDTKTGVYIVVDYDGLDHKVWPPTACAIIYSDGREVSPIRVDAQLDLHTLATFADVQGYTGAPSVDDLVTRCRRVISLRTKEQQPHERRS